MPIVWAGGQFEAAQHPGDISDTSPSLIPLTFSSPPEHVPELEFIAHVNVELGEPLELGSVLTGQRRIIPITGG